jgi:hypothetical protein
MFKGCFGCPKDYGESLVWLILTISPTFSKDKKLPPPEAFPKGDYVIVPRQSMPGRSCREPQIIPAERRSII